MLISLVFMLFVLYIILKDVELSSDTRQALIVFGVILAVIRFVTGDPIVGVSLIIELWVLYEVGKK